MKRSSQRPVDRTALGLVPVLAALFLIGYLASFFHEVTVRHTLCAEHGEWVHESAAVDVCESAGNDLDASPHVKSAHRGSVNPHDHCSIMVASRESRAVVSLDVVDLSNHANDELLVESVLVSPPHDERVFTTLARGPPTSV